MALSKLIPAEAITASARWQFGTVGTEGVLPPGGITDPAALRVARDDGYVQGFEAGRQEALAQCQAQMNEYIATQVREEAERVAGIVAAASHDLDELAGEIARGTLEIACALARQVVRRELSVDPQSLVPVVREALGMLLADGKASTVRLAPIDHQRLAPVLAAELNGQSVQLLADGGIAPGDCRVECAGAVVDGSVEKRWSRAVGTLGLNLPWQSSAEADPLPEGALDAA